MLWGGVEFLCDWGGKHRSGAFVETDQGKGEVSNTMGGEEGHGVNEPLNGGSY